MIDWLVLKWEEFYFYFHDFFVYTCDNLDDCCRR